MNKFIPRIDWKATWRAFEEAHGGERNPVTGLVADPPLQFRGALLFPDGWRYGMDPRHRGPEMPPQSDAEARELGTIYWKMRRASVVREQRELRTALVGLEQAERVHSAPLQQAIQVRSTFKNEHGDEVGRVTHGSKPLDLEGLRERIKWLVVDAEICDEKIKELETEKEVKHA